MKLLGKYKNGNYNVMIFEDGTKIRMNKLDNLVPEFPENIDLKITNYCDMNCPMCHEDSNTSGKHGDILNAKFIDTLRPYTEVAIGGGDALSHPDLLRFLYKLKQRNIIPNITVNLKHFIKNYDILKVLSEVKLIYGIGVSVPNDVKMEDLILLKSLDNIVVHVINGIVSKKLLVKLNTIKDLSLLILGYKDIRRGQSFKSRNVEIINNNMNFLYNDLGNLIKNSKFKVISFDNLALEQLNVKRFLTEDQWNEFYMGNDGNYTMYIDLVENKYAISSTSLRRCNITDDIIGMFKRVKLVREQEEHIKLLKTAPIDYLLKEGYITDNLMTKEYNKNEHKNKPLINIFD